MKDVICILASVKPYDISARNTINSIIASAAKTPEISYDILYCGASPPPDDRVIFLQDHLMNGENSAMNGSTHWGLEKGYKHFMYFSDDYVVDEEGKLFDAVHFLYSSSFENRKFKIATLATSDDPACFITPRLPYPHGGYPTGLPNEKPLPRHMILRFPVIHADTLKTHMKGWLWHPSLSSGYADNYLGFWVGENGEPGLESPSAKLHYLANLEPFDVKIRAESTYVSRRRSSCEQASQLMFNYVPGNDYV